MNLSLSKLYFSLLLSCIVSNSFASKPVWTFTPSAAFPPVTSVSATGDVRVEYIVNNQSLKSKNLIILPQSGVSQTSPCILGSRGTSAASCVLALSIDGRVLPDSGLVGGPVLCEADSNNIPNLNQCYQPSASNRLAITKMTVPAGPVLSASTQNLALSITGLVLDGLPSGQPRRITITNNGDQAANNLSVIFPTWPSGTSVDNTSPTACANTSNLNPGASCTITVVPGATVSSGAGNAACTTGIQPTPSVVSLQSTNSNALNVNVVVLNYGCIYQAGYIYAMVETVSTDQSIGGSVISLADQTDSNGIIWSSNGNGSSSGDVSNDAIPGIAETSTSGNSVPSYAYSQGLFDATYNNTSTFPFPDQSSFLSCDGQTDGKCNSANILNLYNTYNTNFGTTFNLVSGVTNPSFYAAGLCSQPITSFSDWYLPAICQLGPDTGGSNCIPGTQNIVDNLPQLIGDSSAPNPQTSCTFGINCLESRYYSSTEFLLVPPLIPENHVWTVNFDINGSSEAARGKQNLLFVRCVRNLIV